MESGIRKVLPAAEVIKKPMSDGGEGLTKILVSATGRRLFYGDVTGPLGGKTIGFFGILGDGQTGVVEVAAASGLSLVPAGKRDPFVATSCGTGELIRACAARGVKRIILGVGGSATNDGGAGMAQALALAGKLVEYRGREVRDIPGVRPRASFGRSLQLLERSKRICPEIITKSGMMLGLGETETEVWEVFQDLVRVGCDILTIGQYLRPSPKHVPVYEFVTPQRFEYFAAPARGSGFKHVAAGPLVGSSYRASEGIRSTDTQHTRR